MGYVASGNSYTLMCNNSHRSFQSTIFFSRAVSTRAFNCSDLGIVATISLSVSFFIVVVFVPDFVIIHYDNACRCIGVRLGHIVIA